MALSLFTNRLKLKYLTNYGLQIRAITNATIPGSVSPHWEIRDSLEKKKSEQKSLLVGQVYATALKDAIEIQVKKMVLDEFIWMYFSERETIFAEDPNSLTKDGDMVLIKELENKLKENVTHEVVKVLYPLGDTTDPLTGRKCSEFRYRDEQDIIIDAYGVADGQKSFKYDEAPPRGWQEGVKDFSHKPGYRKWNEFPEDHPLYEDPVAT